MRIFYYLSSCDTCKRIAKELSIDNSITQIDIKKNPISNCQLVELYQITGSYEDLVNKKAQLFKHNNLKNQNFLKLYVWGCPANWSIISQSSPLLGS